MRFAGIMIDSIMIDRLEKRWAARCLFLLVFAISVCSNIWPLGDPDLSKLTDWAQEFSTISAAASPETLILPVITTGNIVFFFFSIFIVFSYIFIAVLYSRIYVGEKSGQGLGQSILSYLKRLPILVVFFTVVSIPVGLLSAIIPIILLFVLPALFFSPILITLDKKNPIEAITYSFRFTKGIKFAIFWDLLTLFCMYQLAEWIFSLFLPSGSSAGILLHGFWTAFFVLAFGRMTGVFYDRIRIHAPDTGTDSI